MEEFKYIPLSQIIANPYQPRQEFNQLKLEELAQSIKENGIIQPLIVRKSSIVGYELLAGERRLRASQIAGLDEVPVLVKNLSDDEMRYQSIIENLQRADLNPIEEAQSYKKLIETGLTHEEIAHIMGKSRPYITNSLRLLNLSQPVQTAIKNGQISQGHARLLISYSAEKQEKWLAHIIQNELSVRTLEKELSAPKKKRNTVQNSFLLEEEKRLKKMLGLPIHITEHKNGTGTIQIDFKNIEEYEKIIHSLKNNCE
ncbi:ParB/RepB/Spo0J family partition protein [Streptococcus ovis]|uniref:ParB/RepB/Spo0J family partition protein n=1 Tax=Streptococcus ovis TaxID=82806 RepID=UPI000360C099|nr:ParB/RepB/Spo0J family partition protein [Streptococcus ovis]